MRTAVSHESFTCHGAPSAPKLSKSRRWTRYREIPDVSTGVADWIRMAPNTAAAAETRTMSTMSRRVSERRTAPSTSNNSGSTTAVSLDSSAAMLSAISSIRSRAAGAGRRATRIASSAHIVANTSNVPAHQATASGPSGAARTSSAAIDGHHRPGTHPPTIRPARYAFVPWTRTFRRWSAVGPPPRCSTMAHTKSGSGLKSCGAT